MDMQLQSKKLRPFLVSTGLYLAASLPPVVRFMRDPFPNVLTRINLERTRVGAGRLEKSGAVLGVV